jgi:hypothetical protein
MERLIMILSLLLTVSLTIGPDAGNTGMSGWIVLYTTAGTEPVAVEAAEELESFVSHSVQVIFYPGMTVPGPVFWYVYSGPFDNQREAGSAACETLWLYPDTYVLDVTPEHTWELTRPQADDFQDLLGLFPPTQDFTHQAEVPESWDVEWTDHGSGDADEWENAVRITANPPGWSVDEWEDTYLGTVELRACRRDERSARTFFDGAVNLLRGFSLEEGFNVFEDPGRMYLLHKLPDPEDREGDVDIWVVLVEDDIIEFGYRVRSLYGEMPYSWLNVPEEAHSSAIPVVVQNENEAVDLLISTLSISGKCGSTFPEGISFSIAYLDNLPDDAFRDYYDIAIREVHRPGGHGDPNTAPVVDRFRVYDRGEIIWWQPVSGMFVPYEEFLES